VSSHYFAYGSNLNLSRMRERVASADPVGPGRVIEWHLTLDKRGRDGSGKANIVRGDGGEVWGALSRMDPEHWRILDDFEGGYERVGLDVASAGEMVRATSYTSSIRTPDAVAFDWYQQLILDGAREHELPEDWIVGLLALPVRSDPSRD
jgi:gamma-glutamylcyclotransferase